MALVAGALALVVQTWGQAHLTATRAAIIMTMEPVWTGLFAVVLGVERLGARVVVGGALVLAAMYLVELGPRAPRAGRRRGRRRDPRRAGLERLLPVHQLAVAAGA